MKHPPMGLTRPITGSCILSLCFVLTQCYEEPKNVGIPKPIEQLSASDYAGATVNNDLWEATLKKLKIEDFRTSSHEELLTGLSIPSAYVRDVDAVKGFAASRVAAIGQDLVASKCAGVDALVNLNPAQLMGVSGASGAIKFDDSSGTPTPAALSNALSAQVYLMKYRLRDDTEARHALLTIPDLKHSDLSDPTTDPRAAVFTSDGSGQFGYPLLMYAHAGASGLSYAEIALALGDMQTNHIIAAPAFPGEPVCLTPEEGTRTCTKPASEQGTLIAAAVGTADPYVNDVVDLYGLHSCLQAVIMNQDTANTALLMPEVDQAGEPTGTTHAANLKNKYLPLAKGLTTSITATAENVSDASVKAQLDGLAALVNLPASLLVGNGRGAGVAGLVAARSSAAVQVILSHASDDTGTLTAINTQLAAAGVTMPSLFNCSANIAPQATFTAGKNKIFLDFWVRGKSNFLSPANQEVVNAIPGFAQISTHIATMRDAEGQTIEERAAAIANYVKAIDMTLHAPLINGGIRNWGKVLQSNWSTTQANLAAAANNTTEQTTRAAEAAATFKAASGAGLLLHGAKNKVADFSNAQLASNILVANNYAGVRTIVNGVPTFPGVHWLALGITPPSSALDATGELVNASDLGHVADTSFLGGAAAVPTAAYDPSAQANFVSGIDPADFLNKTPKNIVSSWSQSCKASYNSTAVTP